MTVRQLIEKLQSYADNRKVAIHDYNYDINRDVESVYDFDNDEDARDEDKGLVFLSDEKIKIENVIEITNLKEIDFVEYINKCPDGIYIVFYFPKDKNIDDIKLEDIKVMKIGFAKDIPSRIKKYAHDRNLNYILLMAIKGTKEEFYDIFDRNINDYPYIQNLMKKSVLPDVILREILNREFNFKDLQVDNTESYNCDYIKMSSTIEELLKRMGEIDRLRKINKFSNELKNRSTIEYNFKWMVDVGIIKVGDYITYKYTQNIALVEKNYNLKYKYDDKIYYGTPNAFFCAFRNKGIDKNNDCYAYLRKVIKLNNDEYVTGPILHDLRYQYMLDHGIKIPPKSKYRSNYTNMQTKNYVVRIIDLTDDLCI